MDGLVDCYEMILFILGAMSTTWFGDTFTSFRVSCPSVSYIIFGGNEPSFDTEKKCAVITHVFFPSHVDFFRRECSKL
jgi:hypothetical protein